MSWGTNDNWVERGTLGPMRWGLMRTLYPGLFWGPIRQGTNENYVPRVTLGD